MNSNKTHLYMSYVSRSITRLTKLSISRELYSEYEKPVK
jgi:hypothetical protein